MPNLPYSSPANLPFGGKVLTINLITYIARNWKPEKKTRLIPKADENGDEAAFMLRGEITSQSGLTLQLASNTTAIPTMGTEFTVDGLTYVVTAVAPSYPAGEFWVVDIDYRAKVLPTD